MLLLAGLAGEHLGGFERGTGASPVLQIITQWRLNMSDHDKFHQLLLYAHMKVQVNTICTCKLLLRLSILLKPVGQWLMVLGTSVLKILWIEAHSQALHECIKEIDNQLTENLCVTGMLYQKQYRQCLMGAEGNKGKNQEEDSLVV